MGDCFPIKEPTAKKPHWCEFCLGRIRVGVKYFRFAGTFEGDFYSYALHQRCSRVTNKLMADCDAYESSFEDIRDMLRQHVYNRNPDRPINEGQEVD